MAMQAGQLRKRITIQRRALAQDTFGGQSSTWTDWQTVWAQISPASGSEVMAAQAVHERISHTVSMRYIDGVTAAMRIVYKDRFFNIVLVRNVDERSRQLEILAVEGLASG